MQSAQRMAVADLIKEVKQYNENSDAQMIQLAYEFAEEAHRGQMRATGEEYIIHPLATAHNLARMRMDDATVIAGLLHDVPEDTKVTLKDIAKNFGDDVAGLVEGVTKLGKIKYRGMDRYVENLRKMFVAMARDQRVILIKFADRLHNLETLAALPREKQERIANEVFEIYAPIANRLGMGTVKRELEERAFKVLHPEDYQQLTSIITPRYHEKEKYLQDVQAMLEQDLRAAGVNPSKIESRLKDIYSIYKKMDKKGGFEIGGLYDLVAMRVIVETIGECYATLGVIHQLWRPFPGRIKDYIAQPKPNGYRSLHTTVFCEGGEAVEFQIRTKEMDSEAKFGITAHWNYTESGKQSTKVTEEMTAWLQDVIALPEQTENTEEYLKSLKLDIFQDRIFVFTPKGDVINLADRSTIIDFAYHIHSDVGRRCTGGKVNGIMCSLDTVLRSGDVVEVMTDKNRKKPNADWLKFVRSSGARSMIRAQLREAGVHFI